MDLKIDQSHHVIKFADDILKEGTEIEILTFLDNVLKKLQNLTASDEDLLEPKITENVQFLENEIKENATDKFSLYGVLSTQKVSLENCLVRKEGKYSFSPFITIFFFIVNSWRLMVNINNKYFSIQFIASFLDCFQQRGTRGL